MSDDAFGLLTVSGSRNLGDEIQSLAARQFLPRVDRLVERERLDWEPAAPGPVKLILNGWFMDNPGNWPPHPTIVPLVTSFHLSQSKRSRWRRLPTIAEALLSPRNVGYLRAHGPVGARDPATLQALQRSGVPSYHSGCLTLTLPPGAAPRGDEVVACDLPPGLLRSLERRLGRAPVVVSHALQAPIGNEQRVAQARRLLELYGRAKAVVTTRLHCALPCLAMGTPVLFIALGEDLYRQTPAMELAHSCSATEFEQAACGFDPHDPPANPDRHLPLAAALKRQCDAFVGG